MATVRMGAMVDEARGSVGGVVFSRNAGGLYVRARATPTNPNTTFQQVIRSRMTTLTQAWTGTLTGLQRIGWQLYGDNVPVANRLGDMINLSGINWFVNSNSLRLQAGLDRQDNASHDYTRAEQDPSLAIICSEAAQTFSFTFDNTLGWANETGAALLMYGARPQNITINYFKGPYRFLGAPIGDDAVPPVSPVALASPFPFAEGNRMFAKGVIVRDDGRTSDPMLIQVTAVA